VVERLKLADKIHAPELTEWRSAIARLKSNKPVVRIALVGKYVELHDAYISVRESLIHAGLAHNREVEIDWVHSEDLEHGKSLERVQGADGIVVPGGFGYRGIEGKIVAARIAREQRIPYLGLCLGMQVMCIELARHLWAATSRTARSSIPRPSTPSSR
jgi:CTP synthase